MFPVRIVSDDRILAALLAAYLQQANGEPQIQSWSDAESSESSKIPTIYILTPEIPQRCNLTKRLQSCQGQPLILLDQRVEANVAPDGLPTHRLWMPWPCSLENLLSALLQTDEDIEIAEDAVLEIPQQIPNVLAQTMAMLGALRYTGRLRVECEDEADVIFSFYTGKIVGRTSSVPEERLCNDLRFTQESSLAGGLRLQKQLGSNPQKDLLFQRQHLLKLEAMSSWPLFHSEAIADRLTQPCKLTLQSPLMNPPQGATGLDPETLLLNALALLPEEQLKLFLPQGFVVCPEKIPALLESHLPEEYYSKLFFALSSCGRVELAVPESALSEKDAYTAIAFATLMRQIFALPDQSAATYTGGAPTSPLPSSIFSLEQLELDDDLDPNKANHFIHLHSNPQLGLLARRQKAWPDQTGGDTSDLADKVALSDLLQSVRPKTRPLPMREPVPERKPRPEHILLCPLFEDWEGPLPDLNPEKQRERINTGVILPQVPPPEVNERGLVPGTRYQPVWEPFGPVFVGYLLGQGGMGQLFLAAIREQGTVRPVLLKRLLPQFKGRQDLEFLLQSEGQIGARLHHPAIVNIKGFGTYHSERYVLQEFVHGVSLAPFLKTLHRQGLPIPAWFVGTVGLNLASALHQAASIVIQDQPVVHRDIQPGNILVGFDGNIRLTGFGFSTRSRRRITTLLPYCAPEILDESIANPIPTPAVDQFALGAVLYEMLTGFVCFARKTQEETAYAIKNGLYVPIQQLRPDAPLRLTAIIEKCLSRNPEDRFESPAALHQAILETGCLSDEPVLQISQLMFQLYNSIRQSERAAINTLLEACNQK